MSVLTGSRQIWAYIWEDDGEFAQEPGDPTDEDWKAFGDNEDVSEPDANNSEETYYRPFSRQPSTYHEMEYEGSWGVDFVYTNPWWLSFIYGEPEETDNTADDNGYDLEWQEDVEKEPKSAHLVEETHYSDGTVTQTVYIGVVVDSPDISTAIQDPLDVSLSGFYVDERTYENATNSPYGEIGQQPDTEYHPLNFANTELYLDLDEDDTAEFRGRVQDLDLSFNSNAEPDYELGTRFGVGTAFLDFEPDLSYTARVTDDLKEDEKTSFYGNQVSTSGDAVYPAEEMSDADIKGKVEMYSRKEDNELIIEFGEAFPSSFQRSNTADPESAIDDSVDRMLTSLTATATVGSSPKA